MNGRRRGSGDREATSVLVVAASDVVRAGLEALVANDARFTLVGSAPDLLELTSAPAERALPDVVIIDADRQPEETFSALQTFAGERDEESDAPAFVVIGAGQQDDQLLEGLRAGVVRALVPHTAASGEIIAAVEAVAAGLVALDAETFAALLSSVPAQADELHAAQFSEERMPRLETELDALTPREQEVLEMLAEGLSNKEIAWRLKISEHTVKFHVASVFAKLNVSTRTEAVTRGIRQGLIML